MPRFGTALLGVTIVVLFASGGTFGLDIIPPHARGGIAWKAYLQKNPLVSSDPLPVELSKTSMTTLVRSKHNAVQFPLGAVTSGIFEQKNDHFNSSDTGSFRQRYYVDTTAVGSIADLADAPVFLYISGEGPMSSYPRGSWTQFGYKHGAVVATLEHRFYGPEFPEGSKSTHALRLLTVEQALADLHEFLSFVKSSLDSAVGGEKKNHFDNIGEYGNIENKNSQRKAIIIGGSYSGALSAWYKETYEGDVVGAWSSSGVVNSIVEFVEFDEQVSLSVGPTCGSVLRRMMRQVDADLPRAKVIFNATSLVIDTDFLYMVADGLSMMPQYGHKLKLCSTMEAAYAANQDLVNTFAGLVTLIWGEQFSTGCFYNTACLKKEIDSPDMSRSWRWQKCSQLYWLQSAPKSNSIRSSRLTLDALIQQCRDVFGVPYPGEKPISNPFNSRYGGAYPYLAQPCVFVDASDDPWQRASVNTTLSANQPYIYTQCDDCGHCSDLHTPSPNDPQHLKDTMASIANIIGTWLSKV